MSDAVHRILVVDDDPLNRDMLLQRLSRQGYSVSTAEEGDRALELIEAGRYDVVLLDVRMPGMSGLEVLERIRQTLTQDDLPVIMTTAMSESEDMVEALGKGANDYVTKPIDFAVLAARIKKQLRGRAPASEAAVEKGLLGGVYRLQEVIGRGGFGTVHRARDVRLQRDVAVKMLLGVATKDPMAMERFQREAVTSCRIKHPNAVTVYDFNVTPDGSAYLVMELLRGKVLSDVLEQEKRLPPARCAEILLPVCEVLSQVHDAGLLHRDIKPANVFLEMVEGRECVKVVDFGVAKLIDDTGSVWEGLTVPGSIVGTPSYMAPERFDAHARLGPSSDVYSLGVMLYEMIEGKKPFAPASGDLVSLVMMHCEAPPPALDPALSGPAQGLGTLVRDAMAKEPGDRPSAAEFAKRLREATGGR